MYIQNNTGKDIAAAIGDITFDTSGLMKDTTGQAIVEAINKLAPTELQIVTNYISSADAIDITNDLQTQVMDININKGIWIVSSMALFSYAQNGYRNLFLSTSPTATGSSIGINSKIQCVSTGNQSTIVNVGGFLKVDNNSVLYMQVRQNSGATIKCSGHLRALKVG